MKENAKANRVRIYFNEGDKVRLKGIDGPEMKVRRVVRGRRVHEEEGEKGGKDILVGIECLWFERDGENGEGGYDYKMKREVFNSKDLEHV